MKDKPSGSTFIINFGKPSDCSLLVYMYMYVCLGDLYVCYTVVGMWLEGTAPVAIGGCTYMYMIPGGYPGFFSLPADLLM